MLIWLTAVAMVLRRPLSDAETIIATKMYMKNTDVAMAAGILARRIPDTAHPYTG
jgi:hypothetical protein